MLHESANAKINLFLDVIARREDGYHELESCMQTVGLSDTVSAEIIEKEGASEVTLRCSQEELPCDERNLAYRAATAYLDAAGITGCGVRLFIEKRIPLSAGLGGGSADAAAVLRLLNRYFSRRLTDEQLNEIGARLGADIPFCIHGGTCRARGIGEILSPICTRADYTVLVAKDGLGVSTPEAFSLLDKKYNDYSYAHRDPEAIYRALSGGDVGALRSCVYNIFEDVIFPLRPQPQMLKETMLRCGALCALMSGSGPSVFGIFTSDARAEVCAATLRQKGAFAVACRTVG